MSAFGHAYRSYHCQQVPGRCAINNQSETLHTLNVPLPSGRSVTVVISQETTGPVQYYAARAKVTFRASQWGEETHFSTTLLSGTSNGSKSEALCRLANHVNTVYSVLESDKHGVHSDLWELSDFLFQCYRSDSWWISLESQTDTASTGS